jgi:hypothetical protein
MSLLVYDTGALLAAERSRRELWALHRTALGRRLRPVVPAGVLAQAWRGGPQANLSRFLAGCVVVAMDEQVARAAGALCGLAGSVDVVDASVVIAAHAFGGSVVTSDPVDLRRLLDAAGYDVALLEV